MAPDTDMSGQIPSLLSRLAADKLARPAAASWICPLIVSTSLGQAHKWLPHVYAIATRGLPPAPQARSPSPALPADDERTNPRRFVVRQIKEALFKSIVLIGVPRVIEAMLELDELVEPGAKDDSFTREEFETADPAVVRQRGTAGLSTIYQDDIHAIFERMGQDMREIRWLSQQVTYGTFLTPFDPPEPGQRSRDPLGDDPRLLSLVTLSSLVPQRTPREILWHLRGALRRGIKREDVESIHSAIAEICDACGLPNVRDGMPRVTDVEWQKEEAEGGGDTSVLEPERLK